jgi:isoquinoline 1-oxidoreductase subunit alpha
MTISLTLNGQPVALDVDPEMPLLWAIRESAGLTGTKFGCGVGLCGACTVHLDGEAVRSCAIAVADAAGKSITTIEGISGEEADAIQEAWARLDVVQCGYCQPGQIMSALALLALTPRPDDDEIDEAMNGNICRCGTYVRIRAAIHEAARTLEG